MFPYNYIQISAACPLALSLRSCLLISKWFTTNSVQIHIWRGKHPKSWRRHTKRNRRRHAGHQGNIKARNKIKGCGKPTIFRHKTILAGHKGRKPERPRLDHHRLGDNDDLRVWCDRWSEAAPPLLAQKVPKIINYSHERK